MSTTEPTTETPPKPEIMPMNVSMLATDRCDRCGAQAHLEVEVNYLSEAEPGRLLNKKAALKFCAHHAREHHDALLKDANVTRIVDHRPALEAAEKKS
jgi:hypothetical protein